MTRSTLPHTLPVHPHCPVSGPYSTTRCMFRGSEARPGLSLCTSPRHLILVPHGHGFIRILSFAPPRLGSHSLVSPSDVRHFRRGWGYCSPSVNVRGETRCVTYSGLTASYESLSYFTLTPWLLCILRCDYSRAIHLGRLARVIWQLVSRRTLTLRCAADTRAQCTSPSSQTLTVYGRIDSSWVAISSEWSLNS